MTEIIPKYDPDFMGNLWYLNHYNEIDFGYTLAKIKKLEWENRVNRIRAPHVVSCDYDVADFRFSEDSHKPKEEREAWRFLNDLFVDAIEVAASHLLKSYKDLPYSLSAEDAIYFRSPRGLERKYVWTAAVYGGEISGLVDSAKLISDKIKIYNKKSRVKIRGKDNQDFYPNVAVMEVILIDEK